MLDIPLSIVAWISVVLVQAVVHYFVFGARRARMQHEEDLMLEESLSLATNEGSTDTDDSTALQEALTVKDCGGYTGTIISATMSPGDKILDGDEPSDFLNLLSQTGTELLKVS